MPVQDLLTMELKHQQRRKCDKVNTSSLRPNFKVFKAIICKNNRFVKVTDVHVIYLSECLYFFLNPPSEKINASPRSGHKKYNCELKTPPSLFVAYKQRQILETVILLSLFTGQQTDNEKLIVAIFKKF